MGRLCRYGAVLLLAALVACSGGGGSKPAEEGSNATAAGGPGTTKPGTTKPGTTKPGGTGQFTGAGSAEYCAASKSYAGDLQRFLQPGNTDQRGFYQAIAQQTQASVAVAPAEIKADVKVVADAMSALADALDKVNYDVTKLTPELIAGFMSTEFSNASTRVTAYAREVCGVAG